MVQIDGRRFGLDAGIVKPPSQEDLWDWMWNIGYAQQYDPDPSFGRLWCGAQYLSLELLSTEVQGSSVVELGAGIGLCGLVAAKRGASHVSLVDREPLALHMAMSTAKLNGLDAVSAHATDFNRFEADGVDLVLGSDILYDNAQAMKQLAVLCGRLLKPTAGRALIADPKSGRAFGARNAFCDEARALGARVDMCDFSPQPGLPEPTVLITLRWSPSTK